jgi:carbamate kinase
VRALAPLARDHDLVVTHGNGPQVGLLALESSRDPALSRPYPFDVLGAQTQGMIGYWLVQALQNAVPGKLAGCLICRMLVSADDPAFASPAKFVGPVYDEAQARQLTAGRGWQVRRDGKAWRRAVPSPEPVELLELPLIRMLLSSERWWSAPAAAARRWYETVPGCCIEAVVDKDLTATLLARSTDAEVLLLLTDVGSVQDNYGTPQARPIRLATPGELRARSFPAGPMGPKVDAACRCPRVSAMRCLAASAGMLARRRWRAPTGGPSSAARSCGWWSPPSSWLACLPSAAWTGWCPSTPSLDAATAARQPRGGPGPGRSGSGT